MEFETPEEAVNAVNAMNGVEVDDRKILVREDREDRDLKGYGGEENAPRRERGPRPARGGRGGRGGRGRGPAPPRADAGESSGLQIVVQGIPWKYTWKELKDLFMSTSEVERADVVFGNDGRSRGYGTVRFLTPEAAQSAVDQFHGSELESRTLTVFLDKYA